MSKEGKSQTAISTSSSKGDLSTLSTSSSSLPSSSQWKEGFLARREKGIIRSSWRDKFVILLEGSLFYYQSHTDLTPKGVMHLTNCQVLEAPEKKIKKKFVFYVHPPNSNDDLYFAATNETEKQDWMEAIQKSLTKTPSSPPDKDFIKKNKPTAVYMSGRLIDSFTNLGASGKIAKEFINDDTEAIIEALKSFMIQYYGADKANKLEKQVVSVVVKAAVLYKEKHITKEYFASTVVPTRLLISKIIDGFEIPFTFSAPEAIESLRAVQKSLIQIMRPYLHEKTITKINEIFDILCDEELVSDFFTKRKYKECETLGTTLRKLWDAGAF